MDDSSTVGSNSFITNDLIPEDAGVEDSCRAFWLRRIGQKLVWSVVALFPDEEWARDLNKWRWEIVLKIVAKFVDPTAVKTVYTKSYNGARIPFDINEHVGGARKLFVSSEIISLNCSTKVDSDVDITFFGHTYEFISAVKKVLTECCVPDHDLEKMSDIDVQSALATMFDIEFFSLQHAFEGDNATIDEECKLVPILSATTWERSQLRLHKNKYISHEKIAYPSRDLYRKFSGDCSAGYSRSSVDDEENSTRLFSDGYFTRPAYMYVADPNGSANASNSFSNEYVVQNSFRALIMVVLENIGFALEYVDPESHGLCPTLRSRAKKIAKYAERVSKALRDANRILRNNRIPVIVYDWWILAGLGREKELHLNTAFKITDADYIIKSENILRTVLVYRVGELSSKIRDAIAKIDGQVLVRGGGGSGNQLAIFAVGVLVTIVASVIPR